MSDLDGFSVTGDNFYPQMQSMGFESGGDFGFDPPVKQQALYPIKVEQTYSPPQDSNLFGDFDFDPAKNAQGQVTSIRALELDLTPPRSNSESSGEATAEQKPARQRRSTKSSVKEESVKQTQTGRKRRHTRKNSEITLDGLEDDDKRKQSLEKNRLAAAKCRVNKKEKTEQLQRDSHDKAVQNAFLKDQLMRMKEEVQQMNALLLAHASCEGCKSPEDIQKHLNNLGNEFFAQHISGMTQEYSAFANMSTDMHDLEHDHYFSPATDSSMMNPPLPEFNREPEFDVSTPMQTD
ncbi:hypothetical protein LTR05_005205 [Lithohypha guttulata]|uniref:BZIP domain-containing protein n=1 Tax=Lithohypha guttulata TaxID=1690604 RepID=A0AAN7Y6X4_9EURO|nr:hypothetical protein LTR05_005205 [Lithohypha guttulata]